MTKTTGGFAEKTTNEQLDIFTDHLKWEFEEPRSMKCRRLASALISLQQQEEKNVYEVTFHFKNVLHQL